MRKKFTPIKNNIMNSGLSAEIINFNGVHDIDILFENNTIVRHCDYYRFLLGQIKCPMIYTDVGGNIIKCLNPNTEDVFIIEKQDLPIVKKYNFWHIDKTTGYVRTGDNVKLHRLIMNCGEKLCVDHINGIRNDNRRSNLRICSQKQNSYNTLTPKNSFTGYKGVTRLKSGKYRAKITLSGKQIHIGYYYDIKDAINAYNRKAKELFGEFAKLNIIK